MPVDGYAVDDQCRRQTPVSIFTCSVCQQVAGVPCARVLQPLARDLGELWGGTVHFWRCEAFEADALSNTDPEWKDYIGLNCVTVDSPDVHEVVVAGAGDDGVGLHLEITSDLAPQLGRPQGLALLKDELSAVMRRRG
jgi:hypothetical protein